MSAQRDRSGYLGGSDGAPPPPPPGGYAGARRTPAAPTPSDSEPRRRPSAIGWIALASSGVFALALVVMGVSGAGDAIYSLAVVAVQLVVVILVVAAVVDRRARTLGAIALAVCLFVNIGTVGAAAALARDFSSPGSTPQDDRWAAYPGIDGLTEGEILARPSLEESTALAEEVFAAVRERLTADYGFTWIEVGDGSARAERNGYGGDSMLVRYTSSTWATEQPVTGYAFKLDVMQTIAEVYDEHGLYQPIAFNDPWSSNLDEAYLERLYGSDDPRTQVDWEWYTEDADAAIWFYAMITDLANDADGDFRASREAQVAGTDEPVEGLRLMYVLPEALSEADVDEFTRRMAEY